MDSRSADRWSHWYRRAFPAYWIFLFCVLHFPRLNVPAAVPAPDKWLHFVAFGLLAFLLWRFAETFEPRLPAGFVGLAALGLMLYAALDEYSQQFVGRGTELGDFVADAAGIIVVLGALEWRRRATHKVSTADD